MNNEHYFLNWYYPYHGIYIKVEEKDKDLPFQKENPYSQNLIQKIFGFLNLKQSSKPKQKSEKESKYQKDYQNRLDESSKNINDGKIIFYTSKEGYDLILKRTWLNFNMENLPKENLLNALLENTVVKSFFDTRLREFHISRVASAHPSGLMTFGVYITILSRTNYIVAEQYIENGGKPLSEIYLENIYDQRNNFFIIS